MDFEHSARSRDFLERTRQFMREEIKPVEERYWREIEARRNGGEWRRWEDHPLLAQLKAGARAAGLWNMFLPDAELAPGLTTLEYAPIAEQTGWSLLAPEVFNCSAPDTGNMEVLWKYGTPAQQARWLRPLLDGEIRSVYSMTEPDVASSDATGMQATAMVDGDDIVINGRKWWSTGLGHPRCELSIVMARTPDPERDRHHQHTMVLVPLATPGVEIVRMVSVFGTYHEPHGHGELHFHSVRVPRDHVIGAPGEGFAIAQGRLGPGRIHHCMRTIGAAERALALTISRGMSRRAFGAPILHLGGNRERLADARMAIDQARLLTLYAAWKIDTVGVHEAMAEIAAIKVVGPAVLQKVVDDAIQMHGAAGVSGDTPLAELFTLARTLRIIDGPDEVHRALIARLELARHGHTRKAAAEGRG